MNTQEQKHVAWMWQYIGKDPIASQIKPCARMIHEMDPNNPPYPESWRSIGPLYAQPAPAVKQASRDAQRLDWLDERAHDSSYSIQIRLLRDPAINAGMNRIELRTGCGSGPWEKAVEAPNLRAAIDAAMNQPKKGDQP